MLNCLHNKRFLRVNYQPAFPSSNALANPIKHLKHLVQYVWLKVWPEPQHQHICCKQSSTVSRFALKALQGPIQKFPLKYLTGVIPPNYIVGNRMDQTYGFCRAQSTAWI